MSKKLSGLATEGGPIYFRFQEALKIWKKTYEKRGMPGDINVIKFLEHFGELKT